MNLFLSFGHDVPSLDEQLTRQGYAAPHLLTLMAWEERAHQIHNLLSAGLLTMKEALRAQNRLAKIIRKNAIPKEKP